MLAIRSQRTPNQVTSTPRWKRFLNLGLFFALCCYITLSPPVLSLLILGPASRCSAAEVEHATRGLPHEAVSITASNGARLAGIFFPGTPGDKVILLHHGQGVNIANIAVIDTVDVMLHAGASVLIYDYEGYGTTDGLGSIPGFARDAEAAYQYLRQTKHYASSQIVHCGISLGTGAACHVASQQPCAGMLLISPYLSISKTACHVLPFLSLYPHNLFPQPDIGAEELKAARVPVLIMHGEGDPIIPVAQADEVYRRMQGPKIYFRLPGAGHMGGFSLGANPAESGSLLMCKQFLGSLPSTAKTAGNTADKIAGNPPIEIRNLMLNSFR